MLLLGVWICTPDRRFEDDSDDEHDEDVVEFGGESRRESSAAPQRSETSRVTFEEPSVTFEDGRSAAAEGAAGGAALSGAGAAALAEGASPFARSLNRATTGLASMKRVISGFHENTEIVAKKEGAYKFMKRIKKVAHGKQVLEVQDGEAWKRLVHEDGVDQFLRDELLRNGSDVPLSRDAGYHIIQKRTIGISRRRFGKFIAKQAVLQITRDRPAEKKRIGKPADKRGYLEMDLVEAKGRDIGKYVHHPVSNFYWITIVDRLTGWLEVKRSPNKKVQTIAPKLEAMLRKMAKVLKTNVKYIRSDKGSEFKAETQDVMQKLGIKHRFVAQGNRIEQANKTWQKIWYRLMRLGRGDLNELDTQAQAIFNNTISKVTGKTPLEAVSGEDKVLTEAYSKYQKRKRLARYKAVPIQKGDLCRYVLQSETGKNGKALQYKSYRGKHWSLKAYPVVKLVDTVHSEKYYVNGAWRFREQLLKVPGVDMVSRARVVQKHKSRKKDYVDELKQGGFGADLALGDPEDQPS